MRLVRDHVKLALVGLGFVSVASATTIAEVENPSLRGVKKVAVTIQTISKLEEEMNLKVEVLKAETELRLKKAGVVIEETRPDGVLEVMVNAHRTSSGFSGFVSLHLAQAVRLERDKSISALASTWNRGPLAVDGPSGSARERLEMAVAALVGVFLSDLRSANRPPALAATPSPQVARPSP